MNILDFAAFKQRGEKITMMTCYDYTSARLLAQTEIDCLLVGDSAAMTMHGFADTIPATLEMMAWHTEAVARGAPEKCLIADMPFLSYRKSLSKNMQAAETLMRAGAHGLKLEGAKGNLSFIRHLVESGIPVMGHLGLTLQHRHVLGGFKVQGKTEHAQAELLDAALALADAGCFALVLECIPGHLATKVTAALNIPTIGIGAGLETDGQVLVFQDALGLNIDFKPKFVQEFADGKSLVTKGVAEFVATVKSGAFPRAENCY